MLKFVDNLLNRITMYRLVLYYLIGLLVLAAGLGAFNLIPYSPIMIALSTLILLVVSYVANQVFAKTFKAPTNVESVYITALILALIITPIASIGDVMFLFWAGVLAMATKFVLAIGKKHLFNPVAIAVVITAFVINQSASWWVGNLYMTPFVVIGGLMIARKIRREDMVFSFILTAILTILGFSLVKGANLMTTFNTIAFHSSLFFLAFVMLTEPLTSPATKGMQNIFAIIVGVLYAPQIHIGALWSTPELALVVGNVYAFMVSPKEKLVLKLKEAIQLTPDTFDFIFPLKRKLAYEPGQYMEWTLPHDQSDDRGNRRYFTLASSPTENNLRIGIKFYDPMSSYKHAMLNDIGKTEIVAGQRAGDFVLPKDPNEKSVFIAGGIGITPFRSMLKYLVDTHERRNIVVIFSNKNASDIVYVDVLTQAQRELGIKVFYTITDKSKIPANWNGEVGRVTPDMMRRLVPDYMQRKFYLSGPHQMVTGFEDTLQKMQVGGNQIKTDFFPGFV